jgi:hypothetical protein
MAVFFVMFVGLYIPWKPNTKPISYVHIYDRANRMGAVNSKLCVCITMPSVNMIEAASHLLLLCLLYVLSYLSPNLNFILRTFSKNLLSKCPSRAAYVRVDHCKTYL